jgi:hypothetical protein
MKTTLARAVASFLVLIVSVTTAPLVRAQQTQDQSQPPTGSSTAQQPASGSQHLPPVELPENPGRSTPQPNPSNSPAQPPAQPAQPNGVAVAPPIEVSGGAASKPAGVAIAPPKQRQIRSLLIKLGFLAGAGIAVGTVVGLSAASPAHVPNSPGH